METNKASNMNWCDSKEPRYTTGPQLNIWGMTGTAPLGIGLIGERAYPLA